MLSLAEGYRYFFGKRHGPEQAGMQEKTPRDMLDQYYENSIGFFAPGAAIRAIYDAINGNEVDRRRETPEYKIFAPKAKKIVALYLEDTNCDNGNNAPDGDALTRKKNAMAKLKNDTLTLQSRHKASNYKFKH